MRYINKRNIKSALFLALIEIMKLVVFAGIAKLIIESIGTRGNIGGIITLAVGYVVTVWVLDYSLSRLSPTSKIRMYTGTFRTTLNLMCIFFIYMAYTSNDYTYENMHSVELVNAVWVILLLDQVMNIYLNRYREIQASKLSEFEITSKIIPTKIIPTRLRRK